MTGTASARTASDKLPSGRAGVQKIDEALRRVNRALRLIGICNELVIHAQDESSLLQAVCEQIVQEGGYLLAWVGYRDFDEAKSIRPVARAGIDNGYVDAIQAVWAETERGRGPTGTAVRTGRTQVNQNWETDAATRPWRAEAMKRGFRSSLARPLLRDGTAFGVLTIYSGAPHAFDPEEATLLDELADNLAFGINNLQANKARRQAEENSGRLNRALRLIGACNEVVLQTREEQALLDGVCRAIVEKGGYALAWVGYRQEDPDKSIRPVARAGIDDGYVDAARASWGAENPRGLGPGGVAIRTGITQISHDWANNPQVGPWRDHALERGFRSTISLPLAHEGQVFGVIAIYSVEPYSFNPDEGKLLRELADNLAFGIASLRTANARRDAEAALGETEQRYRFMLDNAADGVLIVDPQGHFVYANLAASNILGYSRAELLKLGIPDITPADRLDAERGNWEQAKREGSVRAEILQKRQDGSIVPVDLNAVRLPDGNVFGSFRDISERLQYQSRLQHQATHDSLTDLPNRVLFQDRLEQELRKANRAGSLVALLFLDLDGFKEVNDTLGHETGDVLLQEVSRRLLHNVRQSDTVARVGGDEFLVILPCIDDLRRVEELATNLVQTVSRPYLKEDERAYVTASIGIAIYPNDAGDARNLLMNAERAMHQAKAEGKNRITFFTPELQRCAQENFQMLRDLHEALPGGQFQLHFQPIVDLEGGRIVEVEALARWIHPRRGVVSPATFIPLLERSPLMHEVGDWIFREAVAHARRWLNLLGAPVRVGVNISAVQFRDRKLHRRWAEHLREVGLPGQCVILELTEGVLIQDEPEVVQTLEALREAGVEVAIDDFGTGYSSLSYLHKFSINYLKIDRSFTQHLSAQASEFALSKAIIAMAHELGMKVIAEGVENDEQRRLLIEAGCEFGQGYLFSRPLPTQEIEKLLLAKGSLMP
jgi:diguanylate cyclase (GGDEF)-like protein/PAS domain S-box-containing protein